MDVDSHDQPDDVSVPPDDEAATSAQPTAEGQPTDPLGVTGLSGSSLSAPGTLLGAEAPPGFLAIEDGKPEEYYRASDQIRGALNDLPDQLQQNEESQLADWTHSPDEYPTNLWMDCEYAKKARERTGARVNLDVQAFRTSLATSIRTLMTTS